MTGHSDKKSTMSNVQPQNKKRAIIFRDTSLEDNLFMSAPDLVFTYDRKIDKPTTKRQVGDVQHMKGNEPEESWILLFVALLDFILIGYHMQCFSMYYVTFTEVFETTKAKTGVVSSIHFGMMSLFALLASTLIDSYGCRKVSLAGACIIVTGVFSSVFATNVYFLCVSYGVIAGCGFSFTMLSASVQVQQHFHKHRNMATSVVYCGVPFGQLLSPVITNFFLQQFGWRGALLLHSGILMNIFAMSLTFRPVIMLQQSSKNTPKRVSLVKIFCDFSLLKNKTFIIFVIGEALNRFNLISYMDHTPSRAVFLGYELTWGAYLGVIWCLASFLSRITCTILSRWLKLINPLIIYASCLLMMGTMAMLTGLADSLTTMMVCASLHGSAIGFMIPMLMLSTVMIADVEKFARARALTNIAVAISSFSATPITGFLFDLTQNYSLPFYFAGIVGVVAAMLAYLTLALYTIDQKKTRKTKKVCKDEENVKEMHINNEYVKVRTMTF